MKILKAIYNFLFKGELTMLTIEKTVLPSPEQWEIIIEGMRNPMNSWDKMDSGFPFEGGYKIGDNDHRLMMQLAKAGPVHAKYRRMIPAFVTINAPLYWWKEFDTYKVGTVANSCSSMHKIHAKEFTLEDFSHEHLLFEAEDFLNTTVGYLNFCREKFLETNDKTWWWHIIQLLPESYNQKRTVMLNYEVLANIYHSRRGHKLDCWHTFCEWIEDLPYSELITGGNDGGRCG